MKKGPNIQIKNLEQKRVNTKTLEGNNNNKNKNNNKERNEIAREKQ